MTTVASLQKSLANTSALYSKVHSFHWNVTGPRFQELHTFFETLYTTLWNEIDLIAERIRIHNEFAPKGYAEMFSNACISEEKEIPLADQMLKILEADLDQLIKILQEGVKAAGEEGNDEAEGFFLDLSTGHQKTLWMIRSMQ